MLIETGKFGSVMKRFFTGHTAEILGEILQNAQRAGASAIDFNIDRQAGVLTITDDGTGLTNESGTAQQFLPVVTIARSDYQNTDVAEQSPMGVGLFSIVAHSQVSEMIIASNRLEIALPSDKIWEDAFWENWERHVAECDFDRGFRIVIKAAPEFAEHAENLLQGIRTPRTNESYEITSPARGYEDFLTVRVNGEAVDTSVPEKVKKFDFVIAETEFDGAPLTVGYARDNHFGTNRRSYVNWYGQIVPTSGLVSSSLNYYLHVRQGTPVNPQSPTRNGIIRDEKSDRLVEMIRGKIRAFVLDSANESLITSDFLIAFRSFDEKWFLESCPYFAATEMPYDESPDSYETFEGGKPAVFRYDAQPLLLKSGIEFLNRSETGDPRIDEPDMIICGISTFTPQLGAIHHVAAGNEERLTVKRLYWRVGALIDGIFHHKGDYALIDADREPEAGDWQPITQKENVYAFDDSVNWDISDSEDLVVGTNGATEDKLTFFNSEAMAIWSSQNDEASWEEMEVCFKKSLEAEKSGLFVDTIEDETFDLWTIKNRFNIIKEEISTIEILTENDVPYGAIVTTATGRQVKRIFLSHKLREEKTAA